ncbi:MAG: O-antigen ligase family protein [Planctomycetota bacterium]
MATVAANPPINDSLSSPHAGERVTWISLILVIYGMGIPVVAAQLPGIGAIGAADFLMPFGVLALLLMRRKAPLQVSHLALMAFMFAALLSLTMIPSPSLALACGLRWLRLISIVVTFYFGLFILPKNEHLNQVLWNFGVGGLIAAIVGIVIYNMQMEIRVGQQRLWTEEGSYLRAGGLIGNSGAFGHLLATWCVVSVGALVHVARFRYRHGVAIGIFAVAIGTIYVASSRAAMLHLITAFTTMLLVSKASRSFRKHLVVVGALGVLAIVLLSCLSQVFKSDEKPSKSSASLARFIPGLNGGDLNEFTSNRADNWPEFVKMISKSWLLGTGYKTGVRMHEESPDNSYLSVMLETGGIGFTCMSLFVISLLYRLMVLYAAGDAYATLMLPACVGQLTHCLTSDVYTFWLTMPIVYLLLGMIIQRSALPRPSVATLNA